MSSHYLHCQNHREGGNGWCQMLYMRFINACGAESQIVFTFGRTRQDDAAITGSCVCVCVLLSAWLFCRSHLMTWLKNYIKCVFDLVNLQSYDHL